MKIFIEKQNKTLNLKYNGTSLGLLKKLGVNVQDVLIVKNDELISEDEKISDSDSIKILSVVSGG